MQVDRNLAMEDRRWSHSMYNLVSFTCLHLEGVFAVHGTEVAISCTREFLARNTRHG